MMEQPESTPAVVSPSEPLEKEVADAAAPPESEQEGAAGKEMIEPSPPEPESKEPVDEVPSTKLKKQPKPPPSDRKIAAGLIGLVFTSIALGMLLYRLWDVDWGVWFGTEEDKQAEQGEFNGEEGDQEARKKDPETLDEEKEVFSASTGQKPNPEEEYKGVPHLHIAAALKLPKLTRALIEGGAAVNDTIKVDVDDSRSGQTPLHVAAEADAADVAEVLIKERADINAQDNNGQTPLHVAAQLDHSSVVALLLAEEAFVNVQDNNGQTPLHVAAEADAADVAEVLIKEESGHQRPRQQRSDSAARGGAVRSFFGGGSVAR